MKFFTFLKIKLNLKRKVNCSLKSEVKRMFFGVRTLPEISWEEEKKFWQEYAQIYRNLEKATPYKFLNKAILNFIEPKEGEIWLDAGCGPAKMSQLIWQKSQKKVQKIVGVDIVLKPALETLANEEKGFPLELIEANLGSFLPFKDETFDGIVANFVLPYVIEFNGKRGKEALVGVLKEMYRVLKPGGVLVWSTPKKNVHFEWVFLASLPDMLNPYVYVVKKDIGRIIQGTRILRHALQIQEKGRLGIYNFLSKEELEEIHYKIGFRRTYWKKTFARQVWVIKAIKLTC